MVKRKPDWLTGIIYRLPTYPAWIIFLLGACALSGATYAQESADPGWYDGWFGDGCWHYWDGSNWTGEIDCDGNGIDDASESSGEVIAGPGWYDGWFGDGCWHYWNGVNWTGAVDCDGNGINDADESGGGEVAGPGWYDGWFDDGCWHYWDGGSWTGAIDCDGNGVDDATEEDTQVSAAPGWYDGWFGDGCWHYWDGSNWTGAIDCDGNGVDDASESAQQSADAPAASQPPFIAPAPTLRAVSTVDVDQSNGCDNDLAGDMHVRCPGSGDAGSYIASVRSTSNGVTITLTPEGINLALSCGGAAHIVQVASDVYQQIPPSQRTHNDLLWANPDITREVYGHALAANAGISNGNPVNIEFGDYYSWWPTLQGAIWRGHVLDWAQVSLCTP